MNLRFALVGQNETYEYEIERADHDPAIRSRPPRYSGNREQEEADVLCNPRAALDNRALPLRPRQLDRHRHGAAGERASQRRCAREEPRLSAYVVGVEPG